MVPPPTHKSLQERVFALARTLQFAWFLGHLTLIVCAIRYAFSLIRFNYSGTVAKLTYRTSFAAAAVTYGLVVYKVVKARAHSEKRASNGLIGLLTDENVQYLGLALVWLFTPQYPLALIPYAIYSVFHVLVYTRSQVIPTIQQTKVLVPTAGSALNAKAQYASHPIADQIGAFVKKYYEASMSVVAVLEILLWIRLLLAAVLFQRRSWIVLAVYTAFLRSRFSQSAHVQSALAQLEARIDSLVGAQGTPPIGRQIWETIKGSARQFHAATDVNKLMKDTAVPKKTT